MAEDQEKQNTSTSQAQGQGSSEPPAPPVLDEDKLGKLLQERLADGMRAFYQERDAKQQAAQQAQQAQAQAQADTFGQLIAPYVQPAVQQLQFANADTRDYTAFYMQHQEAIARQAEIETKFQELARQGRAVPREDINTWLIGREKIQQDRETAAKKALEASTLGSGVAQREVFIDKDPWSMSQEERSQLLDKLSF